MSDSSVGLDRSADGAEEASAPGNFDVSVSGGGGVDSLFRQAEEDKQRHIAMMRQMIRLFMIDLLYIRPFGIY
ncbi:MAG: hypothetical protein J6P39_04400 [Oscillospiraceae bacterium]|nr:hypothetical protein [Oscillospiraceae bacterium]